MSHETSHAPSPASARRGAAADRREAGDDDPRSMVLVGVDGSDDGLRAVRFAAHSVGSGAAERVHLLNAVDDAVMAGAWGVVYDPTILQQAGQKANDAALRAALGTGLSPDQVTSEVVLGNAAAVLARMSERAELMVLGRRSVSGLERMFVGSTSVAAAASSHCPTIVISQASSPGPTGRHGLVVVGLDAGRHAERTLRWAASEARRRGARLDVVHVSEPKSTGLFGRGRTTEQAREAQVQAARSGVDALVTSVLGEFPELEAEVEVGYGNPVDALVGRSGHADLLVVGINANGVTHQVGGTVRGLMAHSQAPVAVIP